MLAIKLRPVGKKKQITYRVVVMEKKSKLVGKFIEDLGWYNPHTNKFSVNPERVKHWIASGAQPTDTVHNILVKGKVQEGTKIPKHRVPKIVPATEAPAAVSAEASEAKEPVADAPAAAEPAATTEEVKEEVAEVPTEEKKEEAAEEKPEEAKTE